MSNIYTIPSDNLFLTDGPIRRASFGIFKDSKKVRRARLTTHFNDVYHLFLYKLVNLTYQTTLGEREKKKLQSLFSDLLRTKALLEKEKVQ